mmetsp:Transcript_16659/g.29953  ORF Transcript_16659/g.29953 Transcript_16659/m.29953 type:complete len:307 (-) Transcript_16659:27-947(-)
MFNECPKKDSCCCIMYNLAFGLTNLAIFFGVFFGVYFSLVVREFEKTECQVVDVKRYLTYNYYFNEYIQYKLAIEIDGHYLSGYGCESSGAYDNSDNNYRDEAYPYVFALCEDHIWEGDCHKDQLLLPRWMCLKLQNAPVFDVGDKVKCYWHYYQWDKPYDSDTPDSDSDLSYPKQDEDFIEVMFKDDFNFDRHSYNTLWILCFGFLAVLPIMCMLLVFIPCYCDVCSTANQNDFLDCCETFWCFRCKWKCLGKRRFFVRRNDLLNPKPKTLIEKYGPWLRTSEALKQRGLTVPNSLLREIASYID